MTKHDYDFSGRSLDIPVFRTMLLSEAFNMLADALIQIAAGQRSFSGHVGYYLKGKLYGVGVFNDLLWEWAPKWLDSINYCGTEADVVYELSVLADLFLRKSKIYKNRENNGKHQLTHITHYG